MDSDGDKAPGPNGFSFYFIQFFWHLFKDDVISLFHSFHSTTGFDKGFLGLFISLIPKTQGPSSINNFRHISLLNWVHKLMTKGLIARFRPLMDSLVSYSQSAFIWGFNIL